MYWLLMVFVGPIVSRLSVGVFSVSVDNIDRASLALSLGLIVFALGFIATEAVLSRSRTVFRTDAPKILNLSALGIAHQNMNIYHLMIGLLFVSLIGITWAILGVVPLLSGSSKYFVEQSSAYLSLRPIYTAGILGSSFMLMFSLSSVFGKRNDVVAVVLVLILTIFLVGTGKRGALLIPYFVTALSYGLLYRNRLGLVAVGLSAVVVAVIIGSPLTSANFALEQTFTRVAIHSFLVSNRELSLVFQYFDGDYLYGASYGAALTSFVPTEYNMIKDEFLYGRYTRHMMGGGADFAGGIRATYIGEAYINFGWPFIIVLSLLFGGAVRLLEFIWLDRGLVRRFGMLGAVLYYGVVVRLLYAGFFEDGSNIVMSLIFFGVALTIFLFCFKIRFSYRVNRTSM
ncbi:hypothetical protein L2D00_06585 [Hyphomonadaceae bacterium BL14]|nr:hypothetical protein L2D00_06585 [Hyphomonadaceae bacterium BL14]